MDLSSEIQLADLKANDIIILFVGLTGSGKSNIIDHLAKLSKKRAGANTSLELCTQKIAAIRVRNRPPYGNRLVLVDTPGFDGAEKSDTVTLNKVKLWLKTTTQRQIRLAGIIYVHPITNNRMGCTPITNLKLFKELCGDNALKKVLLVTTMWDRAPAIAESRETQLTSEYWKTMLEMGASFGRFSNEAESAWKMVESVVGDLEPETDHLDEGMVQPTSEGSVEERLHPKQEIDPETDLPQDLSSDIVIALMGPTGSGKSTIIDHLTDDRKKRASSKLKPCTREISATRVKNHPTYGDRLVLVDTPSFDNPEMSDAETLQMIGNWLKNTYEQGVPLAGIIYLHRIKDNRVGPALHQNIRTLRKLCGDNAAKKVLLVTTMWDAVPSTTALDRENQLRTTMWSTMLEKGAGVGRFYNDGASAWELVELVLKETNIEMLLLQEEMVVLKRELNETSAGKEIYTTLQCLLSEQKQTVSSLAEQARVNQDPELAARLDDQFKEIQSNLEQTFKKFEKPKVPFLRKTILFFSRGPHAKAIKLG